ncbi:MAG: hypothetical protein D3910_09915 [Candidatus Electrothrix sp. ATG2]|nr:hypothetical protein [Candidatus Electrothrix sp. ATG2]
MIRQETDTKFDDRKPLLDAMENKRDWSLAAQIGVLKSSMGKDTVGNKDQCGLYSDLWAILKNPQ